ncbi:hypothetical protein [Natrinema saccharevitans]|nr:hypothetical protein [Natrinema saccharevitans]
MTTTRSVALLVALAVGLTVAPLASGAVVSPFAEPAVGQNESVAGNASVGTLLQASAADTESTVDSEQFEAALENADNESRLLTDRAAELESRSADLEAERERLEADYENGTVTKGAYRSRMSKLTIELASLERSIERTERHAAEAGVATDRLAELRGNVTAAREAASERGGPGVRGVARGLANGGGPPDDAGPPGEGGGPNGPATDPGEEAAGNGPDNVGSDGKPTANGSGGPDDRPAGSDSGGESSGTTPPASDPGATPDGETAGDSVPTDSDD